MKEVSLSFHKWVKKNPESLICNGKPKKSVYLFIDEFTNYNDAHIGIATVALLKGLGYNIIYKEHVESGRAYLSKGLVKEAQQLAIRNVDIFKDLISEDTPLIGIEPSGILSFRDEYPKLVDVKDAEQAHKLGKNCLMLEEFLYREAQIGNISAEQFDDNPQHYLIHGHCHQKALSSQI